MSDPRELSQTAAAAARAAIAVHREHLGKVDPREWSEKGVSDFVTFVDREAEEEIVAIIRSRHPDHTILAEEGTGADAGGEGSGEWTWVIDPLDGTTNYLHRYPAYAASVAVLHRGEPVAGSVISGATGEEWCAHRGGGATMNGETIEVSKVERLDHALIGTGFPFKALDRLPLYLRQFDAVLRHTSGIRRAGSAALDLCHLATGYFDGFWELVLAPWDIAAGTLIAREAGAIVSSLDGPLDILAGGAVLAGNPVIHGALGELLEGIG